MNISVLCCVGSGAGSVGKNHRQTKKVPACKLPHPLEHFVPPTGTFRPTHWDNLSQPLG